MARQGGLGRGLGALIPGSEQSEGTVSTGIYRELAISDIHPNPYQPRDYFDDEALESLTASIRELGVLQPVLVRETSTGYELIAGERRWRSAARAGLTSIPAIVRDVDDLSSLAQAVVDNIHRQDLHALEEAAAYQQLLEDFGLTHEELGLRVGKSRAAVTNALRLLHLPASVQRYVAEGVLSAGHARAILGCPTAIDQEELATRIVEEGLSVRGAEQAVRELLDPTRPTHEDSLPPVDADLGDADIDDADGIDPGESTVGVTRPAAFLELEQMLAEHLSTKVRIQMGAKKGRLTVEFADLDDLERLYRVIQR